jgi:hypothetical protein
MKIEVGKIYQTRKAGEVEIILDLGAGRKRFVGRLPDGTEISYFRNGKYSNASKGGHAYDILPV